jgi:GNAT superfamily N-acetyltransferase
MSDFSVRAAVPTDTEFLIKMLLEAINWLPGRNWSRERIMTDPALAHYVSGWMRPDDFGVVAIDAADLPIGAAWLRFLPATDRGYGYVSDDVPELTMGVAEPWRSRGVGRALLRAGLDAARERGVTSVSLSVEWGNFAARMYTSEGFHTVESFEDADTMVAEIRGRSVPG